LEITSESIHAHASRDVDADLFGVRDTGPNITRRMEPF
jgi:hypothetical protein